MEDYLKLNNVEGAVLIDLKEGKQFVVKQSPVVREEKVEKVTGYTFKLLIPPSEALKQ